MDELLKQISEMKKIELTAEIQEDVTKKIDDMKQKANDVMHSTNTGYGLELIPVDVLTDTVLEIIPQYTSILNAFMWGFHGNQMGVSEKQPIVWEVPFAQGNSEWTTGAGALSQGIYKLPTADVTITQYNLLVSVDISRREMAYGVGDLQARVLANIAKSLVRTAESAVINADPNTSSTGNVNSDDQAPATTFVLTGWAKDHRLLGRTGLRKTALGGTVDVDYKDLGTLDMDDLFTLQSLLGMYSTALSDLVILMDYKAYFAALKMDDFKEYSKNGKASTVITGALTNIAGVDLFVPRDFPATEADGKCSATSTNNTKGSVLYVWKTAVQRGYWKDGLDIEIVKIPWLGYQVIGTMDFGFAIVDKKADMNDPTVVLGINVS